MVVSFTPQIPNHIHLPNRVARLTELAYNLWWTWNSEAQLLYRLIDRTLWEQVYHNPVAFLHQVKRPAINAAINDRYFMDVYDRVMRNFDAHLQSQNT
jgi:starch phosphorylase